MAQFKLVVDGIEIELFVVTSMGFGGEQGTIVYEAAGGDGGVVILTGRKNKNVSLVGRLISKETDGDNIYQDLSEKNETLETIRDQGKIVKLIAPVTINNSGLYIIRSYVAEMLEGQKRALSFTMELVEYRQKGVKRSAVNLVNFRSGELLKQQYRTRTQGG